MKFRPVTDEGDYQIKLRNMRRFLEEGDKIKVNIRFRGREMSHQELGREMAARIETDLGEEIVIESRPRLEGRQMVMMIAPKKKYWASGRRNGASKCAWKAPSIVAASGRTQTPDLQGKLQAAPARIMRGPVRRVCSSATPGPAIDSFQDQWLTTGRAGRKAWRLQTQSRRLGQ